jgi:hypothetical protein
VPMIRLSIDQRSGRKGNRALVLLSLLYVLLCLGGAIGLAFSARGEFSVERAPVVALFMSAAVLILFFVPLWGIDRGMPWKRSVQRQPVSADFPGKALAEWTRSARPALVLCTVPCAAALIARVLFGGIPLSDILPTSLVVLSFAMCALVLGLYCVLVCRCPYSSAGVALLIIVFVCTEPVWIGPGIESTSHASALIQGSLLINPFVGMASALRFDIFRTEPFYQICPIGQRRFYYPSWYSVASLYLLVSLFLYWRSRVRLFKMATPSN